jgi:hypothetical protein
VGHALMNSQSEIEEVIWVQVAPFTVAVPPASPLADVAAAPASAPFCEMLGTMQAAEASIAAANAPAPTVNVAKLRGMRPYHHGNREMANFLPGAGSRTVFAPR